MSIFIYNADRRCFSRKTAHRLGAGDLSTKGVAAHACFSICTPLNFVVRIELLLYMLMMSGQDDKKTYTQPQARREWGGGYKETSQDK
mmetsp:Transcript_4605/g.8305  ORF Transcript_4605/g.8305 Transcript_4605/m.8305 type:complete len:88 (-) Transcript_4605:1505-1768(-)